MNLWDERDERTLARADLLVWTRLFRAFRMAINPAKLAVALGLVVAAYVSGTLIDVIFNTHVLPNEIDRYATLSPEAFDAFLEAEPPADEPPEGPTGRVFATAMEFKLTRFHRLVAAAVRLDFGFASILEAQHDPQTVVGALTDLVFVLPGWLARAHPWFLMGYSLVAIALWAFFGGALARQAAIDAARRQGVPLAEAFAFARENYPWLVLTPILPLLFATVVGVALIAGGFVLLNLPVLNILGGLLYGVAVVAGLIMALTLLLWVAAMPLYYPAIAVDGSDSFDAISRSFSYVLGRPWQWLFYGLVTLVYGALTYLVVVAVAGLGLQLTHGFVDLGVLGDRFAAMVPASGLGEPLTPIPWDQLGWSQRVTAIFIRIWSLLLVGLSAAFAVSFYMCGSTLIYLLLRRSADGAGFSELYDSDTPPDDEEEDVTEATSPPRDAAPASAPVALAPATAPAPVDGTADGQTRPEAPPVEDEPESHAESDEAAVDDRTIPLAEDHDEPEPPRDQEPRRGRPDTGP